MPKWQNDSVVIVKSFWWHCFCSIRSALRRSILQFIYYLPPRFSNKIQVNTAFKKLSYMCFIPSRAWLKRTFSARKCSKYDRFYSFILTWNQVNNIAWPKNSILLWKHANLRQTYVLSLVWLVYSWFHFRCRYKVQQLLKVVKNQEIGRKNKTRQNKTGLFLTTGLILK